MVGTARTEPTASVSPVAARSRRPRSHPAAAEKVTATHARAVPSLVQIQPSTIAVDSFSSRVCVQALRCVLKSRGVRDHRRLRVTGFLTWLAGLLVHLLALTGFKNRVAVGAHWAIAFLGRGRPQRVDDQAQQVFARHALEETPGP